MAFDRVLRRKNSDTIWLPLTSGLTDRHPKYYYGYRNTETGELFDTLPVAATKKSWPRKANKKTVPIAPPPISMADDEKPDPLDEVLEGI